MKQSIPLAVAITAVLSTLCVASFGAPLNDRHDGWAKSKGRIAVYYENSYVEASIENARLRDVLQTIAEQTPLRNFHLSTEIADQVIFAVVKTKSVVECLKQILQRFSYVIDARPDHIRLLVLSTRPSSMQVATDTELGINLRERREFVRAASSPTRVNELASPSVPIADLTGASYLEHDTPLQRALNALNSQDINQRLDAVYELGTIDDPRATQSLIEATANLGDHSDVQFRLAATRTLVQYATERDFSNRLVVVALERLAGDTEATIAEAAMEALTERTKSQAG